MFVVVEFWFFCNKIGKFSCVLYNMVMFLWFFEIIVGIIVVIFVWFSERDIKEKLYL